MNLRATIEAIFERSHISFKSAFFWKELLVLEASAAQECLTSLKSEVLTAIEEHEKEVICREYRVELPRLADQITEKEEPKSDWPTCSYPGCTDPAGSKVGGKWYCGPHSLMVANQARKACMVCNGTGCHICQPESSKDYDADLAKSKEPIKWITGQPYRNHEP